jgi:transposase InsO family protein
MAVNSSSPPKSKKELAKQLGISRQSLYYKPKMNAKDLAFKAEIEKVMMKHKAYGHKRIAIALKANKKKVSRVMRLFNLKPLRRRKIPFKPEDLNQAPTDIPNLIKGTIIDAENQVWVSDFTYLPYFGRFIYLATIEDFFTRQVIGWAVSRKHNTELVVQAMLNALKYNQTPKIAHSDQGSEYTSKQYLNLLKSFDIKVSMSAKASPWQNGRQESFYAGFKLELGHLECYLTLGELMEAIAGQIHYYNHERIHTALKCPPTVFAQRITGRKPIKTATICEFIQQKNQQFSWNNQEVTKVLNV